MSVLKNKRKDSCAQYLNDGYKIYVQTIEFVSRLSSRYSRIMASDITRVAVNGCRGSMKRARRKFKAYRRMIDSGRMTYEDLWSSVNGIIAYFEKYNDHNRVLKLRRLFYSLFGFSCESITEFRLRDVVHNERT